MYICYVDESGDCGMHDPEMPDKTGSSFFILTGLIVPASKWKISLEILKTFRKKIAHEAYLPYHIEFHCAEMIDPHKVKEYKAITAADKWKIIEEYADTIGMKSSFRLISVIIDKTKSNIPTSGYLIDSLTRLYQAFDEFLKANSSYGLLFLDRANEKHITSHVRRMLGTGANGVKIKDVRIDCVIEDPIFRVSADSMFIQSADVTAYTLKESEFPQTSRKKHQAHRIFSRKLSKIVFKSRYADEDGLIRI